MFWAEIWKISDLFFYLKILVVKFSVYLNRHVFVMTFSWRRFKIFVNLIFFICLEKKNTISIETWLNGLSTFSSRTDMFSFFECGSGEFISIIGVCNGVLDCSDGKDEQSCSEEIGKLGRVKRRISFKHAQNAQIWIILRMCNVSFGPFLLIHTFCSIQCVFQRTVKALIRLHGYPLMAEDAFSHTTFPNKAQTDILAKTYCPIISSRDQDG